MEKEFFVKNGLIPKNNEDFESWMSRFSNGIIENLNTEINNSFSLLKKRTGLKDSVIILDKNKAGLSFNINTIKSIYSEISS